MQTREYRLVGGITGPMWMGGIGWKQHTATLSRDRYLDPESVTLRDMLDTELAEHGGDFDGARFTGDTFIRITHTSYHPDGLRHRQHEHYLELASCPSVADMVDESAYSTDGEDF